MLLQKRAAEIVDGHLHQSGLSRSALVVMDPDSGDVLAMVSRPAPGAKAMPDDLLDRARYGQYPPGSTT